MTTYRFLSPAEEEMTEAALFYESSSGGLGDDFLDDVQRAIDRLSDYPHSGEQIDSSFRRTLLHRFPFCLIYAVEGKGIVIVAVAHHGRAPGYWRSRVN
ncbi:MAG TPA: type II toxin-antitoxin system RelE/ParE family toxin [Pyrinomonadaceae bacterium]|nr:type II toxin-antitoxin system RelE/ParE family toxin [Pyrinomonadaceae bacterium]